MLALRLLSLFPKKLPFLLVKVYLVKTTGKDLKVAVLYMVSELHGESLCDSSNGSHLFATTSRTHQYFLDFTAVRRPIHLQNQS